MRDSVSRRFASGDRRSRECIRPLVSCYSNMCRDSDHGDLKIELDSFVEFTFYYLNDVIRVTYVPRV